MKKRAFYILLSVSLISLFSAGGTARNCSVSIRECSPSCRQQPEAKACKDGSSGMEYSPVQFFQFSI